ncbi:MAG: PQQ-binding-like beta-propeller repeat protein [Planctomycetes bacterium]|nr:PQQ-binding-like beta-propeller repeat protein [Planctomycetota bacterium]
MRAAPSGADSAGDWPWWRGPNRDGISTEKDWLSKWPKEGPKQLWKVSVGKGYSSVSVSAGKAYTLGNAVGQDTVSCLEAATGSVVWTHAYKCGSDPSYPGPRSTPTVDGDRVYTLSREGHVHCLEASTGKPVWERDVRKDPGARAPRWEFAGSPLVYEKMVILNVGSAGLALDKGTGAIVWKSEKGGSGYASPLPFEMGGVKGVALFVAGHILAVNPTSGQLLWQHPWKTSFDVNAADPIVSGTRVFVSSDYNSGATVLECSGGKPATVWQTKELCTHFSSCVLLGGCLYGFDGNITGRGSLKCLDFATGAVKWTEDKLHGSLCAADGKLLILSKEGELVVAAAQPDAYKELASAQVLAGPCWTVPVLAGGRIYCRNTAGDLVCFEAKKK